MSDDDKRSQEAEDVARAVAEFCEEHRLVNDAEPAMERLVARLVREGQIREAENARKQVLLEGRSVAECLRLLAARIAALKQEG